MLVWVVMEQSVRHTCETSRSLVTTSPTFTPCHPPAANTSLHLLLHRATTTGLAGNRAGDTVLVAFAVSVQTCRLPRVAGGVDPSQWHRF